MKTNMIRNVSLALLATASLFAQDKFSLKAQVPFTFHVGNAILPAGEYMVDTTAMQGVVRVRSSDGSLSAMVLTSGISKSPGTTAPRMVFNKYGDTYFLSQVWPRVAGGRALQPTKSEIQEARNAGPSTESIIAAK